MLRDSSVEISSTLDIFQIVWDDFHSKRRLLARSKTMNEPRFFYQKFKPKLWHLLLLFQPSSTMMADYQRLLFAHFTDYFHFESTNSITNGSARDCSRPAAILRQVQKMFPSDSSDLFVVSGIILVGIDSLLPTVRRHWIGRATDWYWQSTSNWRNDDADWFLPINICPERERDREKEQVCKHFFFFRFFSLYI